VNRNPQDVAVDLITPAGRVPRAALWTPDARLVDAGDPLLEDLALWPRAVLDPCAARTPPLPDSPAS